MSQLVGNSVGFDLHATLIGIFIVQLEALDELSFGIFNHSELLSDVTYWFYLLHPWGNTLGEMMKLNPYAQFFIWWNYFADMCNALLLYNEGSSPLC